MGNRTDESIWKESSTIILVSRGPQKKEKSTPSSTLQYLITKRSDSHPHLATTICFPGGTATEADSSIQWQDYYKSYGQDLFTKQFTNPAAHLPNIYREQSNPNPNSPTSNSVVDKNKSDKILHQRQNIPKQASLRITGIRETFEECGILLCKPAGTKMMTTAAGEKHGNGVRTVNANTLESQDIDEIPSIIPNEDGIRTWQERVRKKPEDFLALCQHFSCLPDLDSLVEWSNWLSPRGLGVGKRFDTIFYVRFSPHPVPTIIDPREVAYAQWASASDILESHHSMENFVPPPQFYEMTRLKDVHEMGQLKTLTSLRARVGLETWCPMYYSTDEGFVAVLPGDNLYRPNHVDETIEILPVPETGTKGSEESQLQHRCEMIGFRVIKLTATAPYRFGQRYPDLTPTGTLITTLALKSSL